MRISRPARWLATLAAVGAAMAAAQGVRERGKELAAVRKEIKALEGRVASEVARRDTSARALRAAELEAAAATRKLADLKSKRAAQESEQRALAEQTKSANRRLDAERAALAEQVRVAYLSGREPLVKLLLSQESPATLGRMLAYYGYFNRARSARIAAVGTEVEKLHSLGEQSARVAEELAALEASQRQEVAALDRSRDERRAALAKLDAEIADDNAALAKMRTDEKRLKDLVDELTTLMAGFPVDTDQPFARLKGKLAWPVQGRVLADYGQPRAGATVKWNGVLLEAARGTPVRAIYRGRVAFADWLPGLGLLIVVDHGGGYMSLYGYNEALLKEAGDRVEPGEPLAQAGDTGGQPRPAVYFEIRRNGEPVDPHAWITRKPTPK